MSDNKVKVLKNRGLGRGLGALIQDSKKEFAASAGPSVPANDSDENAKKLPVASIRPWKLQPRTYIGEDELNELAESIKTNGVVQPILVRKNGAHYEIIAGERRWRASTIAGLEFIPAIVMQVTDKQALEIALVENIQRQNLMALEVSEGYRRLIEEFGYTQEELSEVVGKSRAQVSNSLRLLTLPGEVKILLNSDKISVGHARAILGSENPAEVAAKVVKRGLNVRQTENLVQKMAEFPKPEKQPEKASELSNIEGALKKAMGGLDVSIQNKKGKGKVVIAYNTMAELNSIVSRIAGMA